MTLRFARLAFACAGYTLVVVVCAEAVARIEDRVRFGVPVLHTPNRERDLLVQEGSGIRGRPSGRYKQWLLNRHGFRGPEVDLERKPGCVRVMLLGSSETFGMYEAPGREYPAQLTERLQRHGCYEVINAALYGLTVPRLQQLWESWAAKFSPDCVVIYPTPAFYLAPSAPTAITGRQLAQPAVATAPRQADNIRWASRLLDRIRDRVEFPGFIQRRRVARVLAVAEASLPADWFWDDLPKERLDAFDEHLEQLVRSIRQRGARVILVTHATGFTSSPTSEERDALEAWRSLVLRPSTNVLLEFERAARERTLSVANRLDVSALDAAAVMNGHPQWFAGDLIHFNEVGAGILADLIASSVRP